MNNKRSIFKIRKRFNIYFQIFNGIIKLINKDNFRIKIFIWTKIFNLIWIKHLNKGIKLKDDILTVKTVSFNVKAVIKRQKNTPNSFQT